jgi:hypothetical protein
MFSFNQFSVLDPDTETIIEKIIPPKSITPKPSMFTKSWGDMSDDEEENITINTPSPDFIISPKQNIKSYKIKMSPAEKQAWNKFDQVLSGKNEIKVTHKIRFYNKETKQAEESINTRTLKIVSKNLYDSFKKLINGYKTHIIDSTSDNTTPSEHKIIKNEQAGKIKMANEIMTMAYKDPEHQCCFIYPVIIIYISNSKKITRNYIPKSSKHVFDISDVSYYPNYIL